MQYLVLGAGLGHLRPAESLSECARFLRSITRRPRPGKIGAACGCVARFPGRSKARAGRFRVAISPVRELLRAHFDFAIPTVTAWLGRRSVISTAEAFCRGRAGFWAGLRRDPRSSLDYSQPREALPHARAADAGLPWQPAWRRQEKPFPAALHSAGRLRWELQAFGLRVRKDLGSPELNELYFSLRTGWAWVCGGQLGGSAMQKCPNAQTCASRAGRACYASEPENRFENCDNKVRSCCA